MIGAGGAAFSDGLRPLQSPHLRCISALCAARSFAYLYDMSAFAVLLRLELHPHLGGKGLGLIWQTYAF
ncbi:signal peptidase [Neisseria sp. 74A18]|uniref:signal peptidase n=1 Tax=Neisseria sp. 74A18 TaxID=1696094 RepID=UPI001E2D4451|nr:signal peptidase [Neisseria sp. 74A18]